MASQCRRGWWGVDLPGRPPIRELSTYTLYPYDDLPPVVIPPALANIRTIADLARELPDLEDEPDLQYLFEPPTSCYFDLSAPRETQSAPRDDPDTGSAEEAVFYRDQQDCIVWSLRAADGHVITDDGVDVAQSLPEFLTRIQIENAVWDIMCFQKKPERLTDEQKKYMEHYTLRV